MTSFDRARDLRKHLTEVERIVWARLRSRRFAGYKFRRQMPVGRYIVDFVCLDRRLIIELDGGQHAEQVRYDTERTAWLSSQGFAVLRFWNHEVLEDWEVVEEVIWRRLQAEAPSPPAPLPRGERGE
jgi:very-short-patch-repair endonuclease